jgi:ubiquinone/menaquinone biosynthesis C-methylase UbiE
LKPDFNERAKDWDKDPSKVERARLVAQAMRARVSLDKGMRALEYGCGTGLLSFALQDSLGPITMADSAPGMLTVLAEKIAASGVDNMTPRLLDLEKDPLPVERFDLIYTLMTLHHVEHAEAVLLSFHALLNPGGTLCVADLDQEDGSFHGAGVEVHKGFNRHTLEHSLADIGFNNIRYEIASSMNREVEGQIKEFSVFLCCAEKVQ